MKPDINKIFEGSHDAPITNELIDNINIWSKEYERSKPKLSFKLASKSYEMAKDLSYEKGMVESLLMMGRTSWLIGNLKKASKYSNKAIKITRKIKNIKYEIEALNLLGNINLDLQNYNKSLEYYFDALKKSRKINYFYMESIILNNIGEIYRKLEGYETALEYYFESYKICEKINDEIGKGFAMLNIGSVYYKLDQYDLALDYNKKSLEILHKHEDKFGISYCYHQLAKIYDSLDNKDLTLEYYLKSLSVFEETEDKVNEIDVLLDLQKVLVEEKKYDDAIKYSLRALETAEKMKLKSMMAKACSSLANIYEITGDYKNALEYYKKFHDIEKENYVNKTKERLKNITNKFKMEQAKSEKELYRLRNVELKQKTEELRKKTKELEISYNNIKMISQIGQEITSSLNLYKIVDTLYRNINSLMDAAVMGIGLYNEKNKEIKYNLFLDESERVFPKATSIDNENSLAAWCIRNRKDVFINDIDKEYNKYLKSKYTFYFGKKPESIIYYPLTVKDSVIGMITVQSYNKMAFNQQDLDIIKALASYVAIAINNAQKSQKLEEEIRIRKSAQKKLEKANKKLSVISKLDSLTNIPNRRSLDEVLMQEWLWGKREKKPLSIIILDIDCFKEYNDNYGHLAGDFCLKKVANVLNKVVKRSSDFVARYGGDEFIAILPNTDKKGAAIVAEEIKRQINKLKIKHEFSVISRTITVSMGIASEIPNCASVPEDLIKKADKALYNVKERGRNGICIYGNELNIC